MSTRNRTASGLLSALAILAPPVLHAQPLDGQMFKGNSETYASAETKSAAKGGTPRAATALASGVPALFNLPPVTSPTIFTGDFSHTISVPQGATRLLIQLETLSPAGGDLDIFVRFGADVALEAGQPNGVRADFRSLSFSGNETITVTPATTPALQAGTYFIAYGTFERGVFYSARITATVTVDSQTQTPRPEPTRLVSGSSLPFLLPAASAPSLAAQSFRIDVPEGAQSLTIELSVITTGAFVALFANHGSAPFADPTQPDGVRAEHRVTGVSQFKTLTIDSRSLPRLRAGTYFLALGLFTLNRVVTGTIVARIATGATAGGGPVTQPLLISVQNLLSLEDNALSPGSLARLVGRGLTTQLNGCLLPADPLGPLPLRLGDVTVSVGSRVAPLMSLCNLAGVETIAFQVPFETPPGRTVVTIRSGLAIATLDVILAAASPALVETTVDGRKRAVITRADGSLVTPLNPARPGDPLRAYVSGVGPYFPTVATNQFGDPAVRPVAMLPMLIGINNAGVEVTSARYAANLIGVCEVSFTVPGDAPPGSEIDFVVAVDAAPLLRVFSQRSVIAIR